MREGSIPRPHINRAQSGRRWQLGPGASWSRLAHSLNFHSWRHMGQCCWACCALSHLRMQCMWKQCEHWPHTSGQSSPGTLPAEGPAQSLQHTATHPPCPLKQRTQVLTGCSLPRCSGDRRSCLGYPMCGATPRTGAPGQPLEVHSRLCSFCPVAPGQTQPHPRARPGQ